jgi:hypothetical protein
MSQCGQDSALRTSIKHPIYCVQEVPIYPNFPKIPKEKEIMLKWKDILGENPPEAFKTKDRESYFRLDLIQYHESIEDSIEGQVRSRARKRAVAILKRHGAIPHLPSHKQLKRGSGDDMLDGQPAEGAYVR